MTAAPPNITRLAEFFAEDRHRAILLLVWQSREYLSEAEIQEKARLYDRVCWCSESVAMLTCAQVMLGRELSEGHAPSSAMEVLERSVSAARAAVENGNLAFRYNAPTSLLKSAWDKQHAPKSIAIFKRAAEAARQETHRALVEVCELYPHVIPED